jgi:hypothetical protein
MRRITYRTTTKPKKYGVTDIDLLYLKILWKEQNGKCPITGMDLIMPKTCDSWENGESPYNASLDRIDNSKGYIKGNVRYVSHMANIARSTFSDNELIKFCQAVSDNMRKKNGV